MAIPVTLRNNETADVVIIGGGVIGLSVARALALRGVSDVLLLDRAGFGGESSSAAGGMLAPQAEADCADAFFQLACQSRDSYPIFAASLLEETGTDIELDTTGTLYLAFSEDDERELERRLEWQTGASLTVERLTATEARQLEPAISGNVRGALRFPLDIQVENRRLLTALVAAAEKLGVRLITGVNVEKVRLQRGRVIGVETGCGFVSTRQVVITGGAWTSLLDVSEAGKPALPKVRIEPVRGQMLCFLAQPPLVRHVIYSARGYLVPRRDGRLLAGSTTEHVGFSKEVTAAGLHAILDNSLEIAPALGSLPLVDSWSGLRPRAEDDLPVLGESGVAGLFYATGHYRNGVLLAPITGELLADAIVANFISPLLSHFSPRRFDLVDVS